MAETPSKRPREETHVEEEENMKRRRSYHHILTLLEAEEEDPHQDISSLITTLQQELSSEPSSEPLPETAPLANPNNPTTTILEPNSSSPQALFKYDEDEEKGGVIRHLLEASDDDLGIPHREIRVNEEDDENAGGGGAGFLFDEGLWQFEDETANYYTLLQSELFM